MLGIFRSSRALSVEGPALAGLASGGVGKLVPLRLEGVEGVNRLFEYRLTLQTPDSLSLSLDLQANYPLNQWIGKELSCKIELEGKGSFVAGAIGNAGLANIGAGSREISGLVSHARFIGLESRHALYEVTIRPWLYLATLTSDCKVFQNLSPIEVIEQLLAEYSYPLEKRLIEEYPKRDYVVQYNETDFEFVSRLLQEWGVNYHFEHLDGGHRLILSDHNAAFEPNASAAYQQVIYAPPGSKIDEEYLHAFSPAERITSGHYKSQEYDYTRPKAKLEASAQDSRNTAHAQSEIYRWRGADDASDYNQPNAGADQNANQTETQGKHLARLRMQALRQPGNRAKGEGHIRGLAVGHTFRLQHHPRQAANVEYIVLAAHFEIENVSEDTIRAAIASTSAPQLNGANVFKVITNALSDRQRQLGQWQVKTRIEVQPTTEALRPDITQKKPRVHGTEIAKVTGPNSDTAQSNLYTDQYGRIKVQFPWDRYGSSDQNSSCWLRVSSSWAGNQLGQIQLPRMGQEVLISFIGGDPDQPVCTGRVHNQLNMPPWQLPEQQALSGIRSRELTDGGGNAAMGRSNHLVLDDSKDQIQAQLKSDHQHSQLSLGYITRIEDNSGRKDYRGQGFELRSDGHGVVRAKDGLLISTEDRVKAQSHMLDMDETVARLEQARGQHQILAEQAQSATAQDKAQDQQEIVQVLKEQNTQIKGADAKQGQFPELQQPHLVLASAAGINTTSEKTTHLHSNEHIVLASGQHTSLSAAKRILASAMDGIRIFTAKAGMKLIAASGKVEIQAQADAMLLLSKLGMTITSLNDEINITAKKKISLASKEVLINGGGSYSRWINGSVTHGTTGAWVEHAASHSMTGPSSTPLAALPQVPRPKPPKGSRAVSL